VKYIVISKDDLSVDVVKDHPESGFVVPVKLKAINRKLSPFERMVYYDFLYPARYEEDRIKYPGLKQKGIYTRYKLIEPPPWMIAMAYVMWEGIIEGLAWDAVEPMVWSAMTKLSSFGVAPGTTQAEMETQAGFSWARYGTDPRKRRDMFIGLKRLYTDMSEDKRREVTRSVILDDS
jgi:hypothetical protein